MCGCGQKTPLATRTRTEKGLVKGQPIRFLRGHRTKINFSAQQTRNVVSLYKSGVDAIRLAAQFSVSQNTILRLLGTEQVPRRHGLPTGQNNPVFKHGYAARKNGRKRREYTIYQGMIQRCTNPKSPRFEKYGGSGVRVAKRWLGPNGFAHFIEDMGDRPTPRHSIGRFLDLGDYRPNNCSWMTWKQQATEARKKRELSKRRAA